MSDESEDDQYPAAWNEVENHDSEDHESEQYESEDHDSNDSETEIRDSFIDVEAEESDEDDEDEDDDYDENHDDGDEPRDGSDTESESGEPTYFPQFTRLPAELRLTIWELVDPYLKCRRVMQFHINDEEMELYEDMVLRKQTKGVRTLLSVNQESRKLGLQHYPNVVNMRQGQYCIPFNSSTDVLLLAHDADPSATLGDISDWCSTVKYVGLNMTPHYPGFQTGPHPADILDDGEGRICRPNGCDYLKAVFLCFDANEWYFHGKKNRKWITPANTFEIKIKERGEYGLKSEPEWTFYWPDVFDTDGCAKLPLAFQHFDDIDSDFVRVWPMMEADGHARRHLDDPWANSDVESVYESELDDYQIDDFVVNGNTAENEDFDNDDESDVDIGPESSDPYNGDTFNGFSPIQDGSSDIQEPVEALGAAVSSLEPESPTGRLPISSDAEEEEPTMQSRKRNKRHIISSDAEDHEDENEELNATSRRVKRARVVLSDSEEGEDDEVNEVRTARTKTIDSDDDSAEESEVEGEDEEDESEEDEEEEKPRPMTLMQKLAQFRSEVPVSPEEGSGSAEEYNEENEEDYDEENEPLDAEFPVSEEDMDGFD
ncbi:hypothetical protein F5Y16DRAFT_375766 [Xylariaceae sp. FL0255]|nr:hypothetical protein F5Y16DRAFT_375766 [Xylariaceae sp. FL0255]